jgi:hypothetical protein
MPPVRMEAGSCHHTHLKVSTVFLREEVNSPSVEENNIGPPSSSVIGDLGFVCYGQGGQFIWAHLVLTSVCFLATQV